MLVCCSCGSDSIEKLAWVDVNSEIYLNDVEGYEDYWCRNCETHFLEPIDILEYLENCKENDIK